MTFDFKNASQSDRKREYTRIAKEIGGNGFFTKIELNHLPEILSEGEQVLAFTSGLMDRSTWLVTLTDKRIIFLYKGMICGPKQTVIDLDKVTSISSQTGVFFGKIVIEDGTSSRRIDHVRKKTVVAFSNKVRDAIEARKSASRHASVPQTAGDNVVTKLEKLVDLLERATVNQDEFTQQKDQNTGIGRTRNLSW